MATTLLTPTVIAKEALIQLENNMVFGNLIHRAFSNEFKKVGDTVLIRKPHEFSTVHDFAASGTVTAQTIVESSVPVILNKLNDITFPITAKELSLNIVDFSEQTIMPAMRAHAQAIDAAIAARYVDIAAHAPVSATPAVADIAAIRTQLNLNKVPFGDRAVVLHPSTEAGYIVLDAFLHAEKRGDTQALKEASMGRVFGMDWYMDQNIPIHTATDCATNPATLGAAATVGATVIKVIGATSTSATIPVGDVLKISGELYDKGHVVTTAATLNAGSASVTIAPAIQVGGVASAATVTWQETHKANLALHRNAIALVTAPLEAPLSGQRADVVNYKGISCRVVYDYDSTLKSNNVSIDILFGVKTLDRELACRLCDAR
jgi:hypothetical protein